MLQKNLILIMFTGILIFLASCRAEAAPVAQPEPATTSAATGTIILADISDEPAKKIKLFQPLADYLAANLGDFDIGVGEVKIAPDMATMAQWMAEGEVDVYMDSLYPAMIISDQSGAQPILRRWKGGTAEYHTIFFTLADSELSSLADLQGQMMAFEEPFSTSGYMLPKAHLTEAGLNLVEKPDPNAAVAEGEVGYIFSEDDENTIQWVISRQVPAGAIDNQSFEVIPEETRAKLKILAETEALPRQVVIVRPGMAAAQLEAIKTLLMDLDETEEGQALLMGLKETAKFDEFPEGTDAALTRMCELYDLVQNK